MNRDFTAYDDMLECYRYDGFFDPNGKYYLTLTVFRK